MSSTPAVSKVSSLTSGDLWLTQINLEMTTEKRNMYIHRHRRHILFASLLAPQHIVQNIEL